ncbi:hypothetical protein EAS64_28215 [Trebonia kvetii]|uniref:WD40 repeat domain-containing protein n=1 Tax=Trebonia kvetii TaxID=2480626 RepID=A0A6P2BWP5_9ACTN|nr:hypothetical protein [Trebonia kvetii]TVZ02656.1 hypothetical protein EAS64_28215 [Trebonia kvetii]
MSAKDRVSTAAEATAASVREIRPLALPENSAAAAGPRQDRGRTSSRVRSTLVTMKEIWMIPLGAAAAVAALAVSLVALRHAEPPRPAPANGSSTAAGGMPRYYAIATEGPVSHDGQAAIDVIVGDVLTGTTLATVALPAIYEGVGVNPAVGVSATANDRAFVVGARDSWGNVGYFLVRIAPGTKQVATLTQLPVPLTSPGELLGFAVSPDGKELAALSVRGNGTTLRIYSVTSGAVLRTWIAGTWRNQTDVILWQTGVSWTADGRQVAFSTVVTTGKGPGDAALVERTITAARPSGDLAAASKVVLKAPGNCASLLLTPDGGTVVCATRVDSVYGASPVSCGKTEPMFVAYSAATGKRLRVLYRHPGPCASAVYSVLWSDASARHVIGEAWTTFSGKPPRSTDRYGVAAAGKFTKFPVAKHGQWYSGPAF